MTYPPTYTYITNKLKEIADNLLHDGVVVLDHGRRDWGAWRKRVLLHPSSLRKMVRFMAKDMKRPFVWAECYELQLYDIHIPREHRPWEFYCTLHMPRLRYTEPLASALLLSANNDRDAPLRYRLGHKTFRFYFRGKSGRELFDAWREQCRTNPEFRNALRLPAE